jgi:hypothetical protein
VCVSIYITFEVSGRNGQWLHTCTSSIYKHVYIFTYMYVFRRSIRYILLQIFPPFGILNTTKNFPPTETCPVRYISGDYGVPTHTSSSEQVLFKPLPSYLSLSLSATTAPPRPQRLCRSVGHGFQSVNIVEVLPEECLVGKILSSPPRH